MVSFGSKLPTDEELLDAVHRHALVQNEVRPLSAVGSYNLHWALAEKQEYKKAYEWLVESVKRADLQGEDVLKATARIELAGSLLWGDGCADPKKTVDFIYVNTLLEEFDDICRLLDKWHMGTYAHGENSQEEIVREFVKQLSPQINKLKRGHFAQGVTDIYGIHVNCWSREKKFSTPFKPADRGQPANHCVACGKEAFLMNKCGACHSRAYCSKACQLVDWKGGHRKVCKELTRVKNEADIADEDKEKKRIAGIEKLVIVQGPTIRNSDGTLNTIIKEGQKK